MPNNINPLPSTGDISIGDIANAFYLYKTYSDGLSAAIDSYYGDLIKYYDPLSPSLPVQANVTIDLNPFHGKRFAFPVPLVASGNNYNVYDQADAYTVAHYGYKLNTPGIPFNITVTNTGNIGSKIVTSPNLIQKTETFTTAGSYTWNVPVGVTAVNLVVVGGGGGGAAFEQSYGGGGGGGGQVTTANNVSVTPGQNISIQVGSHGAGGTVAGLSFGNGYGGGSSSFGGGHTAAGGGGGKAYANGGAGGLAGGAGGSAGSAAKSGGKGGTTLAAPYGVGGSTGSSKSNNGVNGTDGAVLITYVTVGSTTTDTQGAAAMVIGTSSDGSKSFNDNTLVFLNNSGAITGATNTTAVRSYPPGTSFTVNENQTSVNYKLAGGGGSGGWGQHADHGGPGPGGRGGTGEYITGSMAVTNGDVVSFTIGAAGRDLGGGSADGGGASIIYKNSKEHARARGGGAGSYGYGRTGTTYSGGGGGGNGGGNADGHSAPPNTVTAPGAGSATVSYTPNLPGGPALFVTRPIFLINTGTISGGTSSSGARNAGHSIVGVENVTFTQYGTINGGQI